MQQQEPEVSCDPLKSSFKHYRSLDYAQFCAAANSAERSFEYVAEASPIGECVEPSECPELAEFVRVQHVANGLLLLRNALTGRGLLSLARDAVAKWPALSDTRTNLHVDQQQQQHSVDLFADALARDNCALRRTRLFQLRWSSLGYHYNWTERCYSPNCRSPMPRRLEAAAAALAASAGWRRHVYEPQAAIVNYYHLSHSMCFHIDDAEPYIESPLVSISIGQPGAYLLAGSSRCDSLAVSPVPLLLGHGDAIVMTEASRAHYHAVARVHRLPTRQLRARLFGDGDGDGEGECKSTVEPVCFCESSGECKNSAECRLLWQYISQSRININVRQLLRPGQMPDALNGVRF